ncbi:3'(2'),5'-bisphosphate nucleotidase CysQ [Lutimonas saemankumensis]|uniref:3'(2'),5'-bisphosphate nucleotidase CysQ n=1 Tax=Lutimonas saemankumensis TaxID=483016 RepID=UPI001CD78340|nr:3'(2'),5'-bisphosphate nucleotidase CysQ [Lutimonas saemankumensis]MCA0931464.1 3'(2'),5'-bisphosphate nucleotidase CysQ [Lutimonas saemankumensis]
MNKSLKIAVEAAVKGGEAIMTVYAQDDLGVEFKDDQSPLTLADKKCNDIINSYLEKTEFPVISEENKLLSFEERKGWDTCWIVDPLDGTKEFVKRNGEFTVNIALIQKGKPLLGVIYVPDTKELYVADVRNSMASKFKLNEHSVRAEDLDFDKNRIEPNRELSVAVNVVGSRSHMNDATSEFVQSLSNQFEEVNIVSKGSSLKFCLVAEGKADVYPRFAPTMEWDTAAGQAICEAVGLEVISKETDEPLLYNKENLLNPWFIVKQA